MTQRCWRSRLATGRGLRRSTNRSSGLSGSIVWLPSAGLPRGNPPKVLSLVDGGVYDNLGLDWFQGWSSGRPAAALNPAFRVVVNASGLLPPTGPLALLRTDLDRFLPEEADLLSYHGTGRFTRDSKPSHRLLR